MIPGKTLEEITEQGFRWVLSMQARHRKGSRPLAATEIAAMGAHFEPETLALARIAKVREVQEPPFVGRWRKQGVPGLVDFRQTAGIVFVDTILVAEKFPHGGSRWHSLLFHELVHVAQWRLLTPGRMIREYMEGWARNGFAYHRIPMEVQAFELQTAFDRRAPAFSVEARVRDAFSL
jgi:hypothetical protein